MFMITCGYAGVELGLMKCMLSITCAPAGIGNPTPVGMFISMISPGSDVAYSHVPPPKLQETRVPSGCAGNVNPSCADEPGPTWYAMKWWLLPGVIHDWKAPTST